jgi:hypothetical protein
MIYSKFMTSKGEGVLKLVFCSKTLFRILVLLQGARGYRLVVYDYAHGKIVAEGLCGCN